MFEVGWTEMLVIAIVMIVVVGPKDLPNMLRTFGRMAAKARGMANDFRRQFDEAIKEAELDDVKKSVESLRSLNPATEIRKQLNPFEKAAADVRAGLDQAMKPKPATPPVVEAADAPAKPAEPLKNGATDLPGVEGPQATPAFPPKADEAAPATAAKPAAAKRASKAKAATAKASAGDVGAAAGKTGKGMASTSAKPAPARPTAGSPAATAGGKAGAKAPASKVAKPETAKAGRPEKVAPSAAGKPTPSGKASGRKRAGS